MNIPASPRLRLSDELLKRTTSRCVICHAPCPAEVWRTGGIPQKVLLKRTCPQHGESSVCISSDARFYWLSRGSEANSCGCGPGSCCSADGTNVGSLGRNADPGEALGVMEKLSTCLALIEIVSSCNLSCPTCYADSPLGAGQKVNAVEMSEIKQRIQGVIDRKGKIELLQLSGGEPTLHPQFFELLRWLHGNPGIDYVLLNTNGVRLAHDEAFARELATTFKYGRFQLYLQFDGVQEAGQQFLRGADLRATRERCLARCQEMKLPVTLAMTVTPDNLAHLWETVEFGLRWSIVRGVSFQPVFGSGRTPPQFQNHLSENANRLHPVRLNAADIILSLVDNSGGQLKPADFTPLPCGDPNCAVIGYLLKIGGQTRSVSEFINFQNLQDFLGSKLRYRLEDLAKCGCESEPLGELLKRFELDESHTFRLFIKPFMDSASWDQDRIDRCCTHVIRPDGKLDSFCRYYSGNTGA